MSEKQATKKSIYGQDLKPPKAISGEGSSAIQPTTSSGKGPLAGTPHRGIEKK